MALTLLVVSAVELLLSFSHGASALSRLLALAGVFFAGALTASVIRCQTRLRQAAQLLCSTSYLRLESVDATSDLNIPPLRWETEDELSHLQIQYQTVITLLDAHCKEALQDAAQVRAILAGVESGVLSLDLSGRIQYANDAAGRLLTKPTTQLLGKTILECSLNEDLSDFVGRCAAGDIPSRFALREGANSTLSLVLPVSGRHIEARARPIDGSTRGVLLVLRDLEEADRLDAMRRDFTANVSHELRTPLASMRAMGETLLDGALQDPAVAGSFLNIIIEEADRLTRLTDDILNLAQYESHQIETEPVLITELLSAIVQQIRAAAEARGLLLTEEVEESLVVSGDRSALRQLFLNLLDNAIKYTTTGKVTVRASARKYPLELPEGLLRNHEFWVQAQVIDTGPGIPPEHLSRIFERFYRADPDRSRATGGTGLGLSIVRHVAEAHHGRVDVQSVPGQGSTFTVWLPAHPAS